MTITMIIMMMMMITIIIAIIIIITTIIIMMISTTIFQSITEKLEKMTFCFHFFGGVVAAQLVICHPRVRKGVIKLR